MEILQPRTFSASTVIIISISERFRKFRSIRVLGGETEFERNDCTLNANPRRQNARLKMNSVKFDYNLSLRHVRIIYRSCGVAADYSLILLTTER